LNEDMAVWGSEQSRQREPRESIPISCEE